jgi:hypothetical protein
VVLDARARSLINVGGLEGCAISGHAKNGLTCHDAARKPDHPHPFAAPFIASNADPA